jgi:NADPH2:quinone reductase
MGHSAICNAGPAMKAIRVHATGEADVLRLEEIPDPVPAAGEALIRLEAIGVNFIEIYQRKGQYPMAPPFTPGTEGAGTVVGVGPGVSDVQVGKRVVSESLRGSYAQLAVAPAARLVRLPDVIDTKTAAAVMLQGMTAHYLAASSHALERGDTCLVHAAAGGVGLLLCQIAKRRGARVLATVSTSAKAALAREAGADEVILYTEQDFVAEVKRLTDGRGVRAVYDSVGKSTFDKSLECLMPRGLMVLFGQSSGPVPPIDPQLLNRKGSLFLTRPKLADYTLTRDELAARAADILGWVIDGSLKVRIDRTYDLADAAEAHRALEQRQTTGKILLLP